MLENEEGEKCTTRKLEVSHRNDLVEFSPRQLGTECSNFRVISTTKVWVSTGRNSSLCLSHVILDTADNVEKAKSKSRSQICKFDQDEFYKIYTSEELSIPLICT